MEVGPDVARTAGRVPDLEVEEDVEAWNALTKVRGGDPAQSIVGEGGRRDRRSCLDIDEAVVRVFRLVSSFSSSGS